MNNDTLIRLSIALYNIGRTDVYHWTLVTAPAGHSPVEHAVDVYQVTDKRGFWELNHRDNIILNDSSTILGLVELPLLQFPMKRGEFKEFLEGTTADAPPSHSAGVEWTCERWVMEVLTLLSQAEYLEVIVDERFFHRIKAYGKLFEKGVIASNNDLPVVVPYER